MVLLVQARNHKWAESVWCMSRMGMGMGIEFVYVCFSPDSAANEHLYIGPPLTDHPLSSRIWYICVKYLYSGFYTPTPNSLQLQGPEMRMVNGTVLCNFLPRLFFPSPFLHSSPTGFFSPPVTFQFASAQRWLGTDTPPAFAGTHANRLLVNFSGTTSHSQPIPVKI